MKRILLRSGKSPFRAASAEETLEQNFVGNNVGNLVFSDSAHKMLDVPGVELTLGGLGPRSMPTATEINERFDHVVLPFANAFRPQFELTYWTTLIERLKVPVTVLSVGAQTTLDGDVSPLRPMDDQVKRFVRAVLERSPSIGVRGEVTARYIRSLGFSDVEVIGCPSLFRYGRELDVREPVGPLSDDALIGMYTTRGVEGSLGTMVTEHTRKYPRLRHIGQDISELRTMLWGDASEVRDTHHDLPIYRTHPLYREDRFRLHLDPITWIRELREYDFVFGTRIHGNIVSLLAGTPSTVLCHDSRTLELSEYFEIPRLEMRPGDPAPDAAELYERADYGPLLRNHGERFDRMTGYLEKQGLAHVYQPDHDGGASFEQRISTTAFAPVVTPWDGEDDGLLRRFGVLRTETESLKSQQPRLSKDITAVTGRVAKLEQQNAALEQQNKELRARLDRLEAAQQSAAAHSSAADQAGRAVSASVDKAMDVAGRVANRLRR
ncbi:polysaccharide pyruvyl transferase family protein [Streptomyces sp. NPDC060243]|uniref:polysaccharide pyruvyl transferase family protein n=1 Tax=Streptomyces sp. NPDC060243 TaxID=3347081 RepID=UPI003664563C